MSFLPFFFCFQFGFFSLRYCFLPFSAENMHSQFRFQQFTSFFFPSHLLDCFRFFLVIHCCCEETYKKAFCLLFLSIFTNFTFHFHFFQHTKPKKSVFFISTTWCRVIYISSTQGCISLVSIRALYSACQTICKTFFKKRNIVSK